MAVAVEVGSRIGPYRIEGELGHGGMGRVFVCDHVQLRRKAALKVLAPALADDASFRERFIRESQLVAAIEHPNMIPIYDAGEVETLLFIAMRYVDGRDLKDMIAREGRLDVARALEILGQAAAALDAALETATGSPAAVVWPFHGMRTLLHVLGGATFADAKRSIESPGVISHAANRGLLAAAEAVDLARHGDTRRALQHVAEAGELLGPFVWRRALALRLLAEAALADGWGEPSRWAEESLGFFESAGRERVAAACRGLLRRAGVRVSRRGRGDSEVPRSLATLGITSREVDVLRLIGDGLSNAEIAERLFLSVRTVETHASRLLRKAGLESRSQLVAFATRLEEPAEVR
jgi:DNA-binding CsgD family transcriptional regulator